MAQCPSRFVTAETDEMVRAYERYREGFLPTAGGLDEQARCFTEALPWLSREWTFREWLTRDPKARTSIEQEKANAR